MQNYIRPPEHVTVGMIWYIWCVCVCMCVCGEVQMGEAVTAGIGRRTNFFLCDSTVTVIITFL